MNDDIYEIHAIKYAWLHRMSPDNFIGGDPHNCDMPLNYYVWVISNPDRTVIVDTGFGPEAAKKRDRTIVRPVEEGVRALGIDPEKVDDVIISFLQVPVIRNISQKQVAK